MKWLDTLLGPDDSFTLEDRVLNAILFCSSFFGTLSFINDLILQPRSLFTFLSLSVMITFSVLYFISRKRSNHHLLTFPYLAIYIAFMTIIWKVTGGLMGPFLMYFISLIFITPILTKGATRYIVLAIIMLYLLSLFMIEIQDPKIVFSIYQNPFQEKVDTFATVIYMSIVAFLVISIVVASYNNEKNKVEKLLKAKDKFLSIIAHDLRGPIGSMSSLGKMLLEQENELDEKYRKEFLEHLYKSSLETHDLLDNLLKWARSESSDLSAKPETIYLLECIDDSTKALLEGIRQKNLELEIDISADHIVFADKNMLKTVIRNILSNAIKFTNEGGKISISTAHISPDQIQIKIKDNGIGIDRRIQSRIFSNSDILESLGTSNEPGTGLGLQLSKSFIEKNKGKITLESELDQGSTFLISLPIKEN